MSFVADILTVNNINTQVEMIKSVQTRVSGAANILSEEIKLDAERGVDVSHKEKQLAEMKTRQEDLGKSLGGTMKSAQKVLTKISKEKDASTGAGNAVVSKDPNELRKLSQKLSAQIMQLQSDDAAENKQEIEKLQQQLQVVQSQIQQVAVADGSQSNTLSVESNAGHGGQNDGGSVGSTVDVSV